MGVRNHLVEGVSGTGKTAVCEELRRRGYDAVHGDRELAYQGDPATGAPIGRSDGTAVHWHHLWRGDEVRRRVADHTELVTFFCGGARNTTQLLGLFDRVFVLTVDAVTLRRRLDARASDEWAGRGRAEERALVEELHVTGADTPPGEQVDSDRPLDVVVDDLLTRCGLPLRAGVGRVSRTATDSPGTA